MGKRWYAAMTAAVAAGALALPVGAAGSATVVMPFRGDPEPFGGTAVDDCRGGLTGTLSGTGVVSGEFIDTPTEGYRYQGTDEGSYRIDFTDGSYATGAFHGHFEGGGPAMYTSSLELLDRASVYSPAGASIGLELIHIVAHVAGEDRLPLGPGPEDVVHVQFDRYRLTCAG